MISTLIADSVTAKGEIVSIDAANRKISVKRKTSKGEKTGAFVVSKKASISIGGELADFDELETGQTVSLTFDTQSNEVVAIIVDPTQKIHSQEERPKLFPLSELDTKDNDTAPWLSTDGMTLFYSVQGMDEWWIWKANRKTPESTFIEKERLLPGGDMSVTADGLLMVLINKASRSQPYRLMTSELKNDSWTRPIPIEGLPTGAVRPCISSDGLTLYFEVIAYQKPTQMMYTHRKSRESEWSRPQRVQIMPNLEEKISFGFYPDDGLSMFCKSNSQDLNGSNLLFLSRTTKSSRFGSPAFVSASGVKAFGNFPRYAAATKELFFASPKNPDDPKSDLIIQVIKGFDPSLNTERSEIR